MLSCYSLFVELDLMDNNNWRPIQGGEPAMDTSDWRTQLQPEYRQRIVNEMYVPLVQLLFQILRIRFKELHLYQFFIIELQTRRKKH